VAIRRDDQGKTGWALFCGDGLAGWGEFILGWDLLCGKLIGVRRGECAISEKSKKQAWREMRLIEIGANAGAHPEEIDAHMGKAFRRSG